MSPQFIIDASFIAAAFLFIYGLKRMSSPVTARSGIVVAGWGMLVAVLASFLYYFGVAEAAKPHLLTNAAVALVALALGVSWAWWSAAASVTRTWSASRPASCARGCAPIITRSIA